MIIFRKLEELHEKIKDSITKLKEIFETINKNKEEIKNKISKIFTKIREAINERDNELLLEIGRIYEKKFFKEE